jgi:hypothetical protein
MTDQRIEKWEHWLEEGISNDVYSMNLQRFAWLRMQEIIDKNADLKTTESYFWEFIFDIYAKTQAQAVRRQADVDKQAASLGRLIREITDTPERLTRDWYVAIWGRSDQDEDDRRYWKREAETYWAETFAGEVGDHIDPAITGADLTELRDGSEKVRRYVDKHVAHFDASVIGRGPPNAPSRSGQSLPTLNEVHDAIDLVGGLFKKYSALFTAAAILDLTPALQHDWEAVFRMPWITEEPEWMRVKRLGLKEALRLKAEESK